MLSTIYAIILGGYFLNGNEFAMALTLFLIVLIYL